MSNDRRNYLLSASEYRECICIVWVIDTHRRQLCLAIAVVHLAVTTTTHLILLKYLQISNSEIQFRNKKFIA
jgi:hypothetical protein